MRNLFFIQAIVGFILIVAGLMAEARPYILLDNVLTETELHDDEKHDAMLALLQKGAGRDAEAFLASGAVVFATSLVGLWRKPVPSA